MHYRGREESESEGQALTNQHRPIKLSRMLLKCNAEIPVRL